MVGLLDSSRVILGVVMGIPALVGMVALAWMNPRVGRSLQVLSVVVAVALTGFLGWAVLSPGVQKPEPPPASGAGGAAAAPGQFPGVSPGGIAVTPGGTAGGPVPASCAPAGPSLRETARGTSFVSACLAAPAGRAFTITFQNQDAGIPHDIAIFTANPTTDPSARSLFMGKIVTGPTTVTYRVPAIPAGRYFFRCAVHPAQMFGTFVVGG